MATADEVQGSGSDDIRWLGSCLEDPAVVACRGRDVDVRLGASEHHWLRNSTPKRASAAQLQNVWRVRTADSYFPARKGQIVVRTSHPGGFFASEELQELLRAFLEHLVSISGSFEI